jgi:subtilisin family serine protease
VQYLDLSGRPKKASLNLVRNAIDFDTFRAKHAADKRDGAGVIVGIIDSGIDGRHPAFNDASGKSRILAVWEQDQGNHGNPSSPAKKHPGVAAYSKLDYGRELTGANVSTATDDPDEGHGTHVAGIAAGAEVTSAAGNMPRGIASAAKIIVVKAIGVNQGDPIDGLSYIFQKASELKMPCVVNMSFGGHDDPHDGTDEFALRMTGKLHDPSSQKYLPGRILVAAAGNERQYPIHDQRDLVAKGSTSFLYGVNKLAPAGQASTDDQVNIWVRPKDKSAPKPNIRVAVQHVPTHWTSAAVTPTAHAIPVSVPGLNVLVGITYGDQDPRNGDYNITVNFTSTSSGPLAREQWRIIVTNDSAVGLEMHAWASTPPALGGFDDATPAETSSFKVGSPGSAYDVITVAASCTRSSWKDIDGHAQNTAQTVGDLADFSSPGPLRTCSNRLLDLFFLTLNFTRPAIDIAAPGCLTQSALAANVPITVTAAMPPNDPVRYNRQMTINSNSWLMQGTSMATPVITGLIACLLSDKPDLTQEDVRSAIKAAGKLPAKTKFNTGHPDPDAWGPGLVNAPALMKP